MKFTFVDMYTQIRLRLFQVFVELVSGKQFISFPFISHKTQQIFAPLCVTEDNRIRILYLLRIKFEIFSILLSFFVIKFCII